MSRMTTTLYFLMCLLVLCMAGDVSAQAYIDAVDKGNEAMKTGDYRTALEQYHIAEADVPESPELAYNIGNALSAQGSFEEAIDTYNRALGTTDIGLETKTWANLGNTYFRMGDYVQSVETYQKALELDPTDMDTKFSLELARKMLKEQAEQQSDSTGNQQQQQEKKPAEEEKPEGDPEGEPDSTHHAPGDSVATEGDQEQQPGEQMDPKQMSKEDAERILNALRDDEKDIQKQIRRMGDPSSYNGKDW